MTKAELINTMADKTKLSKKDSAKAIEAVVEVITQALSRGEKVQLVGFGNFEPHKREARKGRNPRTGAEIKIAARTVPVFKAGKALKDAVAKRK
jgi:DNA-binding protein HU-beta